MKLLPALGLMTVGGIAATVLDRAMPQWTQNVGGVAVPPGAIAAGVTVGVLALTGAETNGSNRITGRNAAAAMALGAGVVEVTKLADEEVLPRIPGIPGYSAPAGGTAVAGRRARMQAGQQAQARRQMGAGAAYGATEWQMAQAQAYFG